MGWRKSNYITDERDIVQCTINKLDKLCFWGQPFDYDWDIYKPRILYIEPLIQDVDFVSMYFPFCITVKSQRVKFKVGVVDVFSS